MPGRTQRRHILWEYAFEKWNHEIRREDGRTELRSGGNGETTDYVERCSCGGLWPQYGTAAAARLAGRRSAQAVELPHAARPRVASIEIRELCCCRGT